MSGLRDKVADFLLGVRLVLGDRNAPWGRLALMAAGIGLGTAVLLSGLALPNAVTGQSQRTDARRMSDSGDQLTGPVSVRGTLSSTKFYDLLIEGRELKALRPDPPLPPGVARFPAPGELLVSPALERVLEGPGGDRLLRRLHGKVTGVIRPEGLEGDGELYFYRGSAAPDAELSAVVHHHFGEQDPLLGGLGSSFWALLALGGCAVLVPVVVFVLSTARLAEAARQRRLAALRLIGVDARSLRRIAVGENLVSAVLGVPIGWGVAALLRELASRWPMLNASIHRADLVPVWWHAVLVSLAVPVVVSVIAALALRRTVVDPLGVALGRSTGRRRFWWRAAPPLAGLAGLVCVQLLELQSSEVRDLVLYPSIVLFLLAVPLLLPWLLEVAGSVGSRAGPVAWHLALRRLNFVGGSAARSVSAIAVVVAGVVSLQTFVATEFGTRAGLGQTPQQVVYGTPRDAPGDQTARASAEISALPGVRSVRAVQSFTIATDQRAPRVTVTVEDCAAITREFGIRDCRDGDAFSTTPGPAAEVLLQGSAWNSPSGQSWRIPPTRPLPAGRHSALDQPGEVLVTPAAAAPVAQSLRHVSLRVTSAGGTRELEEKMRDIADARFTDPVVASPGRASEELFGQPAIRYGGLLSGMLVVLLVGSSLLVNAIEQIQESARPMAVLGAVGVRRTTVMWSVFLQNAVPLALALALAVPSGVLLGALMSWYATASLIAVQVDPAGLGLVVGVIAVLSLVVTALTAPTVSRALHPEGLRTG